MKKYAKYIYVIAMVVVLGITVGFAALVSEMSISNIVAEVRLKKDIRVTDFSYSSSTSSASVSSIEYSNKSLLTEAVLPNNDSSITYKLEVTNFGNVEMGIYEITGLPDNLTYEVKDYTLKEKICDSNNSCASGIVKDFYITIKYKSSGYVSTNTIYSLDIKIDFRQFYTISYDTSITNNGYQTEIINGDDLVITFTNPVPKNITVYVDGLQIDSSLYSYEDGVLRYNDVAGNVAIKVPKTFVSMMKNGAILDSSVNFNSTSGLSTINNTAYIRSGTENDINPIYYYRGNVTKNNVLFAGFCWKIVRTTDTGGTKLIYNGIPKEIYETVPISQSEYTNITNDAIYPYTFDSSALTWTSTNQTHSKTGEISFSVATPGDYVLKYNVSSESCCDKGHFYLDGNLLGSYGNTSGQLILNNLTTSSIIKVQYKKNVSVSSNKDNVVFYIEKTTDNVITTCDNTGIESTIGKSSFNSDNTSPTGAGYMYGTKYTYTSKYLGTRSEAYLYGNTVSWDGTNYTLQDTYSSTSWSSDRTTLETKYHYTCLNSTGVCSSVYYIHYFGNSTTVYYLTFTGGKTLETAKDAMFTNTTDSTIKATIDTWYALNMTSYTSKLENTIWCNDRSFYGGPLAGESISSTNSISTFGPVGRLENSPDKPSLECPNQNDSFTLKTEYGGTSGYGNNALKYPVGLLTADEYTLAGSVDHTSTPNVYLNMGLVQWTLSPQSFEYDDGAIVYYATSSGYLYFNVAVSHETLVVRPSVSLAPGTQIAGGDGSYTNPYVVIP